MKKNILIFVIALSLAGCGVSWEKHNKLKKEKEDLVKEYNQLNKEHGDLKSKFAELQKEKEQISKELGEIKTGYEDLKFGAERLFKDALFEFKNKRFDTAKDKLAILLEKHPQSKEARLAKQLLAKIKKKEDEIESKEQQRIAQATGKLEKKYDEFTETIWYYPKYFIFDPDVSIFIYIGKKDNYLPWLRFIIKYDGIRLNVQSIEIKTDINNFKINPQDAQVEQSKFLLWSTAVYDVPLTSKEYEITKAILSSKKPMIRFYNEKLSFNTKTISEKEKQAIQTVLDAFKALGGAVNFD